MSIRAALSSLPDDVSAAAVALQGFDGETWQAFLDYAGSHGVLAVLEPALDRCDLPDEARNDLRRRLLVHRVWAEHVRDALVSLLELFGTAHVETCALKGPVLAERLYPQVFDRPSIDLDVLVRPGDLGRVREVLAGAGYAGDTALVATYLTAHSHHLHFTQAGRPALELHFHAYRGFGTTMPAAALFDRARAYQFAGRVETRVPAPEDEIIYLAAHAAGHSFVRLLWLYDLKQLVSSSAVDWSAVAQRSEALGLATPVRYAVRLLRQWLGVGGPADEATSEPRLARAWLADRLLASVAAPSVPSATDNLGGLIFTALLCDRLGASWDLVSHHARRAARHRAYRIAPRAVPASWSA